MCVLRTGVSGTTGRPLVLLVFFSYVCVENRCIRYDRKATSPFSVFFLMCVLRTGVSGTTGRPLVLLVFFSFVYVENRCIRYDRKATSPFSFSSLAWTENRRTSYDMNGTFP